MVPLAAVIVIIRQIREAHIIAASIRLEKVPMSIRQRVLATLGDQANAVGMAYPSQQRVVLPCVSQHTVNSYTLAARVMGSVRQGLHEGVVLLRHHGGLMGIIQTGPSTFVLMDNQVLHATSS